MLDQAQKDRLMHLFAEGSELPVGERAGFVARACGDDSVLRGELAELLHVDGADLQGFLAVCTLFAHLAFGTEIVSEPVLTGPAIVDASNIESALAGVALGAR